MATQPLALPDAITGDATDDNPFEYTATGVELRRQLTPADAELWGEQFAQLVVMSRSMLYIVGDMYVIGETFFPVALTQAIEQRYNDHTVENAKWVCKAVARDVRHPELSFSHSEAVARVKDPEEQRAILDTAAECGWSSKELRREMAGKSRADTSEVTRELTSEERVFRTGLYRGMQAARLVPFSEDKMSRIAIEIWAEAQERAPEWVGALT